jgi:hypothetical protein
VLRLIRARQCQENGIAGLSGVRAQGGGKSGRVRLAGVDTRRVTEWGSLFQQVA